MRIDYEQLRLCKYLNAVNYEWKNVFTFGGSKRNGSDRECKYFPIGMSAREPL